MRVLVVSAPLPGHVLPLVPLTRALATAGHDVLVATAADAASTVSDIGLPVEDVAPGFDFAAVARGVALRHPLVARAELAGNGGRKGVGALFGAVNARLVDAVRDVTEQFRPDVVVAEPLAVAGLIAAAGHGVPAVRHETNLFDGAELVAATARPALRKLAIDRLPEPAGVIQVLPPSVVGDRPGWPMRYEAPAPAALPSWLTETPAQPRILVSRSTVAGPGNEHMMRSLVAVAGEVDAEIVLVRPEPGLPPELPVNVRTIGWVSLDAVLPTCTAIVHHGGAGTVQAALAAGVPQLVVPGPGDRRYNAELVARIGAGLCVPGRTLAAEHLTRLITDDGLRRVSVTIQDQLAARPSPTQVAERVAALA
ncbi:nucleotide disphospho-sugar-binding domain-containing protein [Cryptosporangium aurantiacum]|uniref:UDP:flavonoid glycosyltransferase YjiC, YdhE family n=1 Tax=Cryptosporangium aurantiacum TaxID=134849 RepID=A0A1M7L4C4_9ACTN|nr:nucleotide disphospho-sugar-binding domain-containing protein [Cryptosporangium aurantiacum]SHM72729.1 UDP:flavonoid glycosyltransferase YjiC, YdhE family [Cryptosporangium aurantiacum]